MGVEENKDYIRRMSERLMDRERAPAVTGERSAAVAHTPWGETWTGRGQTPAYLNAFPDLRGTNDLLLGEGDYVVRRWTWEGTFLNEFSHPQLGTYPPTGKRVRWSGVNIYRMADGRVVELWLHQDDLHLIRQLKGEATIE
jgi:predicted ester cyclase